MEHVLRETKAVLRERVVAGRGEWRRRRRPVAGEAVTATEQQRWDGGVKAARRGGGEGEVEGGGGAGNGEGRVAAAREAAEPVAAARARSRETAQPVAAARARWDGGDGGEEGSRQAEAMGSATLSFKTTESAGEECSRCWRAPRYRLGGLGRVQAGPSCGKWRRRRVSRGGLMRRMGKGGEGAGAQSRAGRRRGGGGAGRRGGGEGVERRSPVPGRDASQGPTMVIELKTAARRRCRRRPRPTRSRAGRITAKNSGADDPTAMKVATATSSGTS